MKKIIHLHFVLLIVVVTFLMGTSNGHGSHSHNAREHHHFNPKDSHHDSVLKDQRLIRDKEHLKEELPQHLTEQDIDNMTPEELEFLYFKTHDLDKNNVLDGLELLNAILHAVDHQEYPYENLPLQEREAEKRRRMEKFHKDIQELEKMVDESMRVQDLNNDGYITYFEFMRTRKDE